MEKPKIISADDPTDLLWEKGVKILTCALYFLSSFILSGAGLFSVRIPLSIGLCAACTGVELLCAAAGGILGGALRLSAGEMLCAVIPVAAITGTVFIMERTNLRKNRRLILSVTVFALHFLCSVGVMLAELPNMADFILIICTSLLCAASVTFYSGTADCIRNRRSPYMLDNHSLVCIVASLCTLLLGSSELSLMGFRPARFFGCFVILTAAYLFSRSGGSIAGIAAGGCIAVSGTGVALSICYGICGLLSGIFSKQGQIVCALVFTLTSGIAALLDGTREGLCVFTEAALAAFIFAVIPKAKLSRIRSNILNPKAQRIDFEFGCAGERLMEAAKAVGSVSECVANVSKGIEALSPASDVMVCMRVRERVCSQCRLKDTFCPEEGDFAAVLEKLAAGDEIGAEDFSADFNMKCPCVPRLADSFNRIYATRNAVNALQANSARNRALACGQFDWTATLLRELSEDLSKGAQILFGKEKCAARVLSEFGFTVIKTSCIQPLSGALRLTCTVEEIPPSTSLSQLTAALSKELEVMLNPPKIKILSEGKELVFLRKELYKIRIGSAAASCGNQKLCGDYFECFQTDSKAYIILSDGMGTGGRAAIDSTMTVELFSRLTRAGVSLDSALSITNSALSVKSDDESLSTLDVAEIDLFDGNTVIYKAGAAPSFYTNQGRIRTVEISSTPLGILSKVKFNKYSLKLHGGDALVMVSDGILGCGNSWLKDEIKAFGKKDASGFSQDIVDSARRRCGERFDDMTVITAVAEEI
ncbi:MAG: PP2C family protein-serine/threonine phosphatase [Acutalibacteraceae bacterium]|nr:PP2C family protein-serine/threonine phosphatase [Acutalibacteraceae bacterium]